MRGFLGFLLAIIKIYISFKVLYVLYMVKVDPIQYPMDEVIWWSGLLIFDIWITGMLPPPNTENKENDDENHLEDFRK